MIKGVVLKNYGRTGIGVGSCRLGGVKVSVNNNKMGNCQFQNGNSEMDIEDRKEIVIEWKPNPTPVIAPITPIKVAETPNNEPDPELGKKIGDFPTLQSNIQDVDEKLGQFDPCDSYAWQEGSRPVYLPHAYQLHNGIVYEGGWNKGNMNGNCRLLLPDGSYVRGFCVANKLVHQARFVRPNGNYYEGKIRNNKANGEGVMFHNGIEFRGHFIDNYLEGKGYEVSPDYRFEGTYHKGARIDGHLTWDLHKPTPSSYDGGFFDEQFNGRGKLSNEIGEYIGNFENGKKKGRGVFTWKNGQRFQGNYDSDLKNGEGKMFNNKNMVVLQGIWQNDRFRN